MLSNTWRNLVPAVATRADVERQLGRPTRVAENVTYASARGLVMLSYESPQATLLLANDRLMLAMVVPGAAEAFPERILEWEQALGKAESSLPSSRGKNCRIRFYGRHGLAPTVDETGRVLAVEIFPPMEVEQYRKHLYKAPPAFVK